MDHADSSARRAQFIGAARDLIGSAKFAHVLTIVIIGTAFSTRLIRVLIGTPGLLAVLGGLVVLCAASYLSRRQAVQWYGILPLSILIFVGWCVASIFWTSSLSTTAGRIIYLVSFGVIAVYVALMRDTIQVVRAFGDVLRLLLGLSLVLEVLSGILINVPFTALGIQGKIAAGGPISGIFGTRNMLGFVALIAVISFVIEWRTQSVTRFRAIGSTILGGICLLFAGSPTTYVAIGVAAVTGLALYGLRRAKPISRTRWQIGIISAAVLAGGMTWALRNQILNLLHARTELDVRVDLWQELSRYLNSNAMQGWGWVGPWPRAAPYTWVNVSTGSTHESALSAYVDTYFQVGIIGGFLFVVMLGLASVRAWLLASAKHSVVYVWPAIVLVVITVTSFAESFALTEGGWLLLVVCAVKSAQDMSWRDALAEGWPAASGLPQRG